MHIKITTNIPAQPISPLIFIVLSCLEVFQWLLARWRPGRCSGYKTVETPVKKKILASEPLQISLSLSVIDLYSLQFLMFHIHTIASFTSVVL